MIVRVYGANLRSRPATIALVVLALGLGAVLIAFGLVLLLGLTVLGTAIGAGVLLFRALTGRGAERLGSSPPQRELDPSLEVFPTPHELPGSRGHEPE
jgi:hypothetical protein